MTIKVKTRHAWPIGLLFLMIGCTPPPSIATSDDIPRPAVVERSRTFVLPNDGIPGGELADLSDRIEPIVQFVSTLDTPASISVSARQQRDARQISRLLQERLGARVEIQPRKAEPWSSPRDLAVSVRWVEASVSGCPDWTVDAQPAADRLHSPNFGCATAQIHASMIARPLDLSHPYTIGPADGTREALAIERYRTDKVKQLDNEGFAP